MGQVRQPPQGQAEHNGEARTHTPEERGKGKQLQNSPPSDQLNEDLVQNEVNVTTNEESQNNVLANDDLVYQVGNQVKTTIESPLPCVSDSLSKVFFCDIQPNNGFFMLFKQFLLSENVDEAQVIIVQASANGQTDCNSF
ncbi:uncharacterized protein LOC127846780 [Dreissena polymorpha]|uniref:Uncharacterized protein n=1 Tax=Dreissena polymorpha TaxID=45954 RepID=A0A9D4EDY4_DREPO|nr:uncharacterized protein LOC127846780 [Dreissena polymorpha]KAH3777953.1 hypothetical protein DPMN_179404 [Dreissena polymorpha]